MNGVQRRAAFISIAMLATAGAAYAVKPKVYLSNLIGRPDLEALFPKTFGDWRLDASLPVIVPAPDVQAALNSVYNQVLSRTYVNKAGERIMLSVAYGGDQSNGTRAHRPEVCYPAQGFQITSNTRGTLAIADRIIAVRLLMSKLGSRNEPITYWVVVGREVATSHMEQKLTELRYAVKGLIADGMLIRVSSITSDPDAGHELQARFVSDLAQATSIQGRSRIFGHLDNSRA